MALEYNIPTYLTLLRIALIPLLAGVYYLPWEHAHFVCTLIFMVAGFTDWLDGYLARKMGLETSFGAFLDPVADKLMVVIVLVLIVGSEANPYIALPSAIIVGREITIASLREWMAELGQRAHVKVSQLGKWKTSFQMLAITLLLYGEDLAGLPIKMMGYVLLYISAILTFWSMLNYLSAALTIIQKN